MPHFLNFRNTDFSEVQPHNKRMTVYGSCLTIHSQMCCKCIAICNTNAVLLRLETWTLYV